MHPQFVESSITFVMAAMMVGHTLARADHSYATRSVVSLMTALMIWTGSVALARVTGSIDQAYAFSCLGLVGAFLVPPAWAWMALAFTERGRLTGMRRGALWLYAPTVTVMGLLATNSLHHMVVAHPERLIDQGARAWAGPVFWPWLAWAYLLVVAGSALYVRASVRMLRSHRRVTGRAWVMVVAALLPLSASVTHTLGLMHVDYDRTPLLLGLSTLLLYVVDWRFRLLDTIPMARRDVIDQLHDGVILTDAEGLIVHMNAAAEQMCEVEFAEVSGRPLARVVAAQSEGRLDYDEDAFMGIVRDMCASPSGFATTIENYEGRTFEIRGSSVSDVEGEVAGLHLILRDRTAGAQYEAMLSQTRRSEAVAGLAAGIAHEVNNPLAYVRANVTHLLGLLPKVEAVGGELAGESDDEMREVLVESLEGIDRIRDIVERLQRLSAPENVAHRSFDVNEVVQEAVRIRGLDRSERLRIDVALAHHRMPAYGQRESLIQAVVEVLENAQDAIADVGGRIEVRTEQRGDMLIVSVADDGPGVPAELRERVFDPFFTTRIQQDGDSGSGLGLAMAAKAVVDLGGSIEIGDAPLGGAQVVVRIPVESA